MSELEVVDLGPTDIASAVGRDSPEVQLRQRLDGVRVVWLSFNAGQTMPNHSAPKPVLLVGRAGTITVQVGDRRAELSPGSALHIGPRVPHSLTANTDAAATLLLLG